jgi:hypothetical protein
MPTCGSKPDSKPSLQWNKIIWRYFKQLKSIWSHGKNKQPWQYTPICFHLIYEISFCCRNTESNEGPGKELGSNLMGRSNEMQEEWRDQYIGGGRLTHLVLPRWQTRSQQATAALKTRRCIRRRRACTRKRRRRAKNSTRAKNTSSWWLRGVWAVLCWAEAQYVKERSWYALVTIGCERMDRMRDCREPSVGVTVEDLVPMPCVLAALNIFFPPWTFNQHYLQNMVSDL